MTNPSEALDRYFVIITAPEMCPQKKGGWITAEAAEDFARDAILCGDWTPGMDMVLCHALWHGEMWVESAYSHLYELRLEHPRLERAAWVRARERHERIFSKPPAMKLGKELEWFRKRTALEVAHA